MMSRCECGQEATPEHTKELHDAINSRDERIRKRNVMFRNVARRLGISSSASFETVIRRIDAVLYQEGK